MGKTNFREFFEIDIVANMELRSKSDSKSFKELELVQECVMYAVDMCIEFQQKSDGLLDIDWIEHITTETCAVFAKIFPDKFREPQKKQVKISVRQLMQMPATALKQVNYYYNR